ncbi:MAG: prolyl oligopeptidase family serine peptidase, partial [Pseudomonadota bacterium]
MIRPILSASAALIAVTTAHAQSSSSDESFGGAKGADLSIEAMEPDGSKVTLGRAGEYPADIARYLLARGPGGANLSPDGKMIAFSWGVTGQSEIWVMPASGGIPKQITFETGVGTPVWTLDSAGLFYSADRDGNEQPGYFSLTPDGMTETEVLPAARGDFRRFGGFAQDGSFIYASTARGAGVFDIYRGTMDGQSELILESELGLYASSISPDGKFALITESVGAAADNIYLLDLTTKELTTISKPPVAERADHSMGGFEWWPNSQGFYFSTNLGREFGTLAFYNMQSRSFDLVFESDADIENLELCGPGEGGSYLYYTQNKDGFDTLLGYDTVSKRAIPMPEMPEGNYSLDCEGEAGDLLIRVNGWQTPGELWMTNPIKGTAQKIFASNLAGLDPDRLVRPQVVRYPARDGVELQGLLYLPEGVGTGEDAPPVVFSVHGGPSAQSQATFDAIAQYHVGRGVAVFESNVRGSTGLGRTYEQLDDRENRLDSVRDLVDLKAGLAADGLIDGDRAA